MQGKILGLGAISGNDGKRYEFAQEDIINLENRNINKLSGLEVDFETDGNEAKNIYIIKSKINLNSIDLSKITQKVQEIDIEKIKATFLSKEWQGIAAKTTVALICFIFSVLIDEILWLLAPIGAGLLFFAIKDLSNLTDDKKILKQFCIALALVVISYILLAIFWESRLGDNLKLLMSGITLFTGNNEVFGVYGLNPIRIMIFGYSLPEEAKAYGLYLTPGALAMLAGLVIGYFAIQKVKLATQQPFFLYGYLVLVFSAFFEFYYIPFVIGYALLLWGLYITKELPNAKESSRDKNLNTQNS